MRLKLLDNRPHGQNKCADREGLAGGDEMSLYYDNFNDVKIGDVFFTNSNGFKSYLERNIVDKVTNTMFMCGSLRFKKKDGRSLGDSCWSFKIASKATPEKEADYAEEITRRIASNVLNEFVYNRYETKFLKLIADLVVAENERIKKEKMEIEK